MILRAGSPLADGLAVATLSVAMSALRALAPLAALVLSAPMTGCYVHGRGAVVVVHPHRYPAYVAPRHYGYYRPVPRVVVVDRGPTAVVAPVAVAPAAPVAAAAPVAVAAPTGVDVRSCGGSGGATVQATFATTGRAVDVRVVGASGALDEATTRCLRERFAGVSIPAFSGAPKTFAWPVDLGIPAPAAAAAPSDAAAPSPAEREETDETEGDDHAPREAPHAPAAAPTPPGAWL